MVENTNGEKPRKERRMNMKILEYPCQKCSTLVVVETDERIPKTVVCPKCGKNVKRRKEEGK